MGSENKNKKIIIFGFTHIIYEKFIIELKKNKINLNLKNSVLIHGGGWKKLENQSVSPFLYRRLLRELCNITNVHDYYGMVEQTGSKRLFALDSDMNLNINKLNNFISENKNKKIIIFG